MKSPKPLRELGPFQLVILVLSFFVLGVLVLDLFLDVPPETARVLRWIDNIVCGFFLVDFGIRYRRAESKLRFMKWGWIDFLASIPEVEALRWGRIFRVFRILRLLRAARSIRNIIQILFESRTQGGVASVFAITFLVLAMSSAGILLCERGPEANIHTAEDAVWWSLTTITTVGYGDLYPTTLAGRILAGALMVTGVGLFGTLSGVLASFFLGSRNAGTAAASPPDSGLRDELAALREAIAAMRPDPDNPADRKKSPNRDDDPTCLR